MKKSENIAIRVSPPVKEALCRIAEREGSKDVSALLLQAVLLLLADRGESLPRDCPEYPLRESAEGSANAQLAALIASVVPRARARSAEWADEYATARFHKLWQKLEELDEPRLMNDAYELFTDGKRTPREQIRAMEFRLDTFLRAREAQQGGQPWAEAEPAAERGHALSIAVEFRRLHCRRAEEASARARGPAQELGFCLLLFLCKGAEIDKNVLGVIRQRILLRRQTEIGCLLNRHRPNSAGGAAWLRHKARPRCLRRHAIAIID